MSQVYYCQKTALAGAVSGLAVAASGGDESDIKQAMALGAGMVFIQDRYREKIGGDIDARGSTKPPYCMTEDEASCQEMRAAYWWDEEKKQWRLDPNKLDKTRAGVGIATDVGTLNEPKFKPDTTFGSDRSPLMQGVAKYGPAANAMSFFHDYWVVEWKMTDFQNKATIIPAIAITYVGTGAPVYTKISKENAEIAEREKSQVRVGNTKETVERGREQTKQQSGAITRDEKAQSIAPGGAVVREAGASAKSQTTPEQRIPGVFEALQAFQEAGGWESSKREGSSVLKALQDYQDFLDEETNKVVAKNSGADRLIAGVVRPKPGKRWVDANNHANYQTQDIEGLKVDQHGRAHPDAGWEWVDLKDPLNMSVQRIEGLEISPSGELQPKENWKWVEPDNPSNFEVTRDRDAAK